ncbi:unnamed protein product [Closterium sp. NIES-65]|nr:unnamed protein product [Closterium sp. NIES-65]
MRGLLPPAFPLTNGAAQVTAPHHGAPFPTAAAHVESEILPSVALPSAAAAQVSGPPRPVLLPAPTDESPRAPPSLPLLPTSLLCHRTARSSAAVPSSNVSLPLSALHVIARLQSPAFLRQHIAGMVPSQAVGCRGTRPFRAYLPFPHPCCRHGVGMFRAGREQFLHGSAQDVGYHARLLVAVLLRVVVLLLVAELPLAAVLPLIVVLLLVAVLLRIAELPLVAVSLLVVVHRLVVVLPLSLLVTLLPHPFDLRILFDSAHAQALSPFPRESLPPPPSTSLIPSPPSRFRGAEHPFIARMAVFVAAQVERVPPPWRAARRCIESATGSYVVRRLSPSAGRHDGNPICLEGRPSGRSL